MSYTRPHEDRLGTAGAIGDVLGWTGTGTAEWKTPSGGGVTVKHLDATDPEAATILRVAHFTVNAANDVTLFPQITGEGTGSLGFFVGGETQIASSDTSSGFVAQVSVGAYTWAEHTPAALAAQGWNLQVGTDLVGFYISEKDSATIQIYDDALGAYNIELVDQGSFGFKTVNATNNTPLANLHWLKNGTADPSAGAGVASAIGSLYQRSSGGVGTVWIKTGAADTAWTLLTSLVGTAQTYTESNVTTDRAFNANSTTIDELADVLGTLIADLRNRGVVT